MGIIKTVTPDEAKHYDCCVHDRNCTGTDCMAWVEETVKVGEEPKNNPLLPPVGKYEKSGKGYCGMVRQ